MKNDSEEFNLNIPPFYPGEEIICVDDSGTQYITKGREYITEFCGQECGCGIAVFIRGARSLIQDGETCRCPSCGDVIKKVSNLMGWKPSRFVSKKNTNISSYEVQ